MSEEKPKMRTEEMAVEKYSYRPLDKVGSVGTLKALLQAQQVALAEVLPRHITPERLFRTLLTAINRQPDLLECTQASIVESVGRAAELGLDVSGTLQEAWILPFNNRVGKGDNAKWVKQAQLLPGYRGLAKLARQSGEIRSLEARVVKQNDFFEVEFGSSPKLVFRPLLKGERGATVSCYALAILNSGETVVDWMTAEDVDRIRKMSKQPDSLMWKEHWDEGARKTVFRRLAKWLPLSAEKATKFREAMEEADREFDLDRFASAVTVTSRPPGATAMATPGADQEDGPSDPGGHALSADHFKTLRQLAAEAPEISWDEYEGLYGAGIDEMLSNPGEGEEEFFARLLDDLKKLKSSQQNAAASLFNTKK